MIFLVFSSNLTMNNQNYLLAKPYVNHVSINELEDRHSMIPTTHKMEHDFGIPSFTSDPTLDKMKEKLAYGVLNQYEKAKLADRIEKLKNRLERTLPENQKKDKKDDDKTDDKDNGDNNDYNYNNDQVNTNRKIQELSDNTKHDSKDKEDHKKDTKDEINAFKIIQKRLSDNSKHDGNDIKDDDKKDAKDN